MIILSLLIRCNSSRTRSGSIIGFTNIFFQLIERLADGKLDKRPMIWTIDSTVRNAKGIFTSDISCRDLFSRVLVEC